MRLSGVRWFQDLGFPAFLDLVLEAVGFRGLGS